MLYHYTDLSALINIVTNKELWLTRIDFLNDKNEYIQFTEIYENAMLLVKDELLAHNELGDYDEDKHSIFIEHMKEMPYSVSSNNEDRFVFSLTHEADSLPMWQAYSSSTGIAIEFDELHLASILMKARYDKRFPNPVIDIVNGDVVYEQEMQIRTLIHDLAFAYKSIQIDSEYTLIDVADITTSILKNSVLFKRPEYQYESEYRFVFRNRNLAKKRFYRVRGDSVIPYIKIQLDDIKDAIKGIIISPLNTSDLSIKGIVECFKDNGINIDESQVRKSHTSLRKF